MAVWKEYAEGCVLGEVTVVHRGSGKKDVAVTVTQSPDSQWNRLFQGQDTHTLLAGFPIAMPKAHLRLRGLLPLSFPRAGFRAHVRTCAKCSEGELRHYPSRSAAIQRFRKAILMGLDTAILGPAPANNYSSSSFTSPRAALAFSTIF